MMIKPIGVTPIVVALVGLSFALPAHAQKVRMKAMEKASFYTAPREIQILDDRPTVRDFREAPQSEQSIDLPPGPNSGSRGAGDLPATLPAGGMSLGRPQQGYRLPSGDAATLPRSGFGQTNIPARGMGPVAALPDGATTNRLMDHVRPPRGALIVSAPRLTHSGGGYVAPAPVAQSYGNSYGSSFGSSSNRMEALVRGSLLGRR